MAFFPFVLSVLPERLTVAQTGVLEDFKQLGGRGHHERMYVEDTGWSAVATGTIGLWVCTFWAVGFRSVFAGSGPSCSFCMEQGGNPKGFK